MEKAGENPSLSVAEPRGQRGLAVRGLAVVKIGRRSVRVENVDISAHGVCMTLPHALSLGRGYRLDLEIQAGATRTMSVVGRVCFRMRGNSGYRVGFNCSLAEFLS